MKKLSIIICAAALMFAFALPAYAATGVWKNPPTWDMAPWVIGALVVAACAIVGTLIFSWKKR